MPRPCFAARIPAGLLLVIAILAIMTPGGAVYGRDPSPPQARIRLMDAEGMAPFTAHVHALLSDVSDPLQTRYEWDFGDGGSPYNKLDGWNAAHLYRDPGNYTIKLKVTDSTGHSSSVNKHVHVTADTRRRIYVSPSGNDSANGTSGNPVRSAARALELVHDRCEVLFERGGQFDLDEPFHIQASNVVVGAYGSGPDPVMMWVGNIQYAAMITMWWWSRDILIQDLKFDSYQPPTNEIVRATSPHGHNITVTRCEFDRVSYAMNTEFGVWGFLAQANDAENIGAYFIWAVGRDHVYLGNHAVSSTDEHTIRLGSATRVLVAHNDLSNTSKATVWAMLGQYCYIAHNTMRNGRILIGPNFAVGAPEDRFINCVADGNLVLDEGFVLYSGAERVMLRNNIIRADARDAITIWGWYPPMNRGVNDVKLYNNTATNDSTQDGCFLRMGDGSDNIRVIDNLYFAPWLNTHNNAANVYSSAATLANQEFRNNIWSVSHTAPYVHFLNGGTGVGEGQWNSFSETAGEYYFDFHGNELDAGYRPLFHADRGRALPGVRTDFYGHNRPMSGKRTVGAVEVP